ncbi:hypothetical protein HMPREF1981_02520, partial [Bacteroides pyogenes F0041]
YTGISGGCAGEKRSENKKRSLRGLHFIIGTEYKENKKPT